MLSIVVTIDHQRHYTRFARVLPTLTHKDQLNIEPQAFLKTKDRFACATTHHTCANAEADDEQFDGKTTE